MSASKDESLLYLHTRVFQSESVEAGNSNPVFISLVGISITILKHVANKIQFVHNKSSNAQKAKIMSLALGSN